MTLQVKDLYVLITHLDMYITDIICEDDESLACSR